jgi:hypothetical protein
LTKGIEKQDQRNAGKRLGALGLDADQKVSEIDRRQDRERKQKAKQELLGGPGIFQRMAFDRSARPTENDGCPLPTKSDRNPQ